MARLSPFMNEYWRAVIHWPPYFNFLVLNLTSFSHLRCHGTSNRHVSLGSSCLWQFLRLFLFSMTLTVSSCTIQVFCGMTFSWHLVDFFPLMIREGLRVWGEDEPRGKVQFSSQRIRSICDQHDLLLLMLTLITWPSMSLSPTAQLPFLSLLVLYSLEGTFYVQPRLKWGKICPTSLLLLLLLSRFLGHGVNYLELFSMGDLYILLCLFTQRFVKSV